MNRIPKTPAAVSAAILAFATAATAATSSVVGYTSTTLPAGAGNFFAPAFVNPDSFVGTVSSATSGSTSTLSVSGSLTSGEFDESVSQASVSKGYPLYYVEVLNDTDATDGLDTEGLVLDVVSNTASDVVVFGDVSTLGLQGDESIAIRKHVTLGDLFDGATGLAAFGTPVIIFNEDGSGNHVTHLPDGAGGFVLGDFVTVSTDAPIYPGTGVILNNGSEVEIVATGTVKETDTQVNVYAGINVIGVMKPTSFDLASDGRLGEALTDFSDPVTIYPIDGTLTPVLDTFTTDGAGGFVGSDFFTPVNATVDGTAEALVINASGDTTYKISGTVIPN